MTILFCEAEVITIFLFCWKDYHFFVLTERHLEYTYFNVPRLRIITAVNIIYLFSWMLKDFSRKKKQQHIPLDASSKTATVTVNRLNTDIR